MKRFLITSMLLAGLLAPLRAEMLVKPGDTVLVAVETQSGARSVGVDIAGYLMMCQPVEGAQVVELSEHWQSIEGFMKMVPTQVAPWRANVYLISHGIDNGGSDTTTRAFTYYNPTYLGNTIDELKQLGARTIVVGSTGCVDTAAFQNPNVPAKTWNTNLAAFRDSDQQVAAKKGVAFADLFTPMAMAMPKAKALYGPGYTIAGVDGEHPDANGQLIMAYGFLKALGCDGAIGTIKVDLAANKAQGSEGQAIISCTNGEVTVESTRYPFCFQGDPKNPESTAGIIAAFPFNLDLNRYLLVVRGITGSRARITWGNQTREFPVVDLAEGVNLAAAFAGRTPFDGRFFQVENALAEQQYIQHRWTGNFFGFDADYALMAPDAPALLKQIADGIVADNAARSKAIAALVIPVRHTIKIESIP